MTPKMKRAPRAVMAWAMQRIDSGDIWIPTVARLASETKRRMCEYVGEGNADYFMQKCKPIRVRITPIKRRSKP